MIELENVSKYYGDFPAITDISFRVEQGEVLGFLGPNGAGKTTLLKILSRIASPTKGTTRIKGRVASLIAVGTGFHQELTGRENIYLNGSILGLRKLEIDERFDEIVDFLSLIAGAGDSAEAREVMRAYRKFLKELGVSEDDIIRACKER